MRQGRCKISAVFFLLILESNIWTVVLVWCMEIDTNGDKECLLHDFIKRSEISLSWSRKIVQKVQFWTEFYILFKNDSKLKLIWKKTKDLNLKFSNEMNQLRLKFSKCFAERIRWLNFLPDFLVWCLWSLKNSPLKGKEPQFPMHIFKIQS